MAQIVFPLQHTRVFQQKLTIQTTKLIIQAPW